MTRVAALVSARPFASTTRKVTGKLPVAAGVPDSTPVEAFRVRPGGRLPALTDHTYGAVPPVTVSGTLKATPTWPVGGGLKVKVGSAATVRLTVLVLLRLSASTTLTEKEKAPPVVGVPDSTPVEAFRVRPGGRLPP